MKQQKNRFTVRIKQGFATIISVPYQKWRAWRQRCYTLNVLRRLNDDQLKDIGLTSHDVDRFR